MSGPLAGLRVVELAGLGPGPHGAALLADLGADVVCVRRPGPLPEPTDFQLRGRRIIEADLKASRDRDTVLSLVGSADVLVEGFRPGVTERLGLGPDVCLAANPGLVYARMTGWGQDGPRAAQAGHDLNYISGLGILHAIGPSDGPPAVPLNLLGDYGGGSLYLVVGILAALFERARSGRGQVVDAAIVDGASHLALLPWATRGRGQLSPERVSNRLDGGAPFYSVYETSDGRFMAVGALEPQFYALLLGGLGLADAGLPEQADRSGWPRLRAALTAAFASRTREEWTTVFAGTDACVTPVLDYAEATRDEHLAARSTLIEIDGVVQPAPAPRFSRSVPPAPTAAVRTDAGTITWKDTVR